jgi:hypothetical protein
MCVCMYVCVCMCMYVRRGTCSLTSTASSCARAQLQAAPAAMSINEDCKRHNAVRELLVRLACIRLRPHMHTRWRDPPPPPLSSPASGSQLKHVAGACCGWQACCGCLLRVIRVAFLHRRNATRSCGWQWRVCRACGHRREGVLMQLRSPDAHASIDEPV